MRLKYEYSMILSLIMLMIGCPLYSQTSPQTMIGASAEKEIIEMMEEGNIAGMSLVMVKNGEVSVRNFGEADKETGQKLTENTLFEIADMSKAFAAIATLDLAQKGYIDIEEPVSKYLPWFRTSYGGQKQPVKIKHLLYQNGGIPGHDMLHTFEKELKANVQTLKQLVELHDGIELEAKPGERFALSDMNELILASLLETVSQKPYSQYLKEHIFRPLGMTSLLADQEEMAQGYKVSFFGTQKDETHLPSSYQPARGLKMSARDLGLWLKWQLGAGAGKLSLPPQNTHGIDPYITSGEPGLGYFYAMGWNLSLSGDGAIYQNGMNPAFSSMAVFNVQEDIAIGVLANTNSHMTADIGQLAFDKLYPQKSVSLPLKESFSDNKTYTGISLVLLVFLVSLIAYVGYTLVRIIMGRLTYATPSTTALIKIVAFGVLLTAALIGYRYLSNGPFAHVHKYIMAWSPESLSVAVTLLASNLIGIYILYALSSFFPMQDKTVNKLPILVIFSLLAGMSDSAIVLIITNAFQFSLSPLYMTIVFFSVLLIYVMTYKIAHTRLIWLTNQLIFEKRMILVKEVLSSSYQKFEKLNRGRILSTFNDDTAKIGGAADTLVVVFISSLTLLTVIVYLFIVAFWITLIIVSIVIIVAIIYMVISSKAEEYLETARDTVDDYFFKVNGLIDGFKELSLHGGKREDYKDDMEKVCGDFRDKNAIGGIKFINAFILGNALIFIVLGFTCFAVPMLFPQTSIAALFTITMTVLYLITTLSQLLSTVPQLFQVRISWKRVNQFLAELKGERPDTEKLSLASVEAKNGIIESLQLEGVKYAYDNKEEGSAFAVGPIDLTLGQGEILFIVGGNGSGKTTLSKLLTGLYERHEGTIVVDGNPVNSTELGEYYSTVFDDFFMFKKLYTVDLEGKEEQVTTYLDTLGLTGKVEIKEGHFSTISLSRGQRKRLALLRCYLEDKPIYLFDEWAADQDPQFRKFFYRELLPDMKKKGKIVIAITHDDHYFDVADKILKMDMGKVDKLTTREAKIEWQN